MRISTALGLAQIENIRKFLKKKDHYILNLNIALKIMKIVKFWKSLLIVGVITGYKL